MPSQQVIEKLKELQTELDTISVAVKHIDDAAKVAESASEIMKNIPGFLNDLKILEEKHLNELLKEHKEKNVELEMHLKTQIENEKLEREVIKRLINKEVDKYKGILNPLIAELEGKIQKFKKLIEETTQLENTIRNYFEEINKINFPERLDKVDNQISAINIGIGNLQTVIQNTQTKIDSVQTYVNSLGLTIEKKISDLENKLITGNLLLIKETKTNRIITIFVGAILIVGLLLLLNICYK